MFTDCQSCHCYVLAIFLEKPIFSLSVSFLIQIDTFTPRHYLHTPTTYLSNVRFHLYVFTSKLNNLLTLLWQKQQGHTYAKVG